MMNSKKDKIVRFPEKKKDPMDRFLEKQDKRKKNRSQEEAAAFFTINSILKNLLHKK
jgi:hypothetical protein